MSENEKVTQQEPGTLMPVRELPQVKEKLDQVSYDTIMFHPDVFDRMERLAKVMASSRITMPAHLKDNPEDCFAVLMQAVQWKMNPWAVAQKTHNVNGNLGYEAQLVHAVVQHSGAISGTFDYEFFGPWDKILGKFQTKTGKSGNPYQVPGWTAQDEEGCGVTIRATLKETGEVKELTLKLSQATVRNSTLWAGDPQQQLGYLAVKRWSRRFCPGAILGVYTTDELEEIGREKDVTPRNFQEPKAIAPVSAETPAKPEKTASKPKTKAPVPQPAPVEPEVITPHAQCITDDQRREICYAVTDLKINNVKFLKGLEIFFNITGGTMNIPSSRYKDIYQWVQKGCPEV
ncbi:MAG: RecT family recombinase [Smithella sp.]|jgi:DNA-binding transcriptional regulator of glucitol operon